MSTSNKQWELWKDRKKNISDKQNQKDISKNTSFNSFVSDRQTQINFLENKIDTLKKDEPDKSDISNIMVDNFPNDQVRIDEILNRLIESENKIERLNLRLDKEKLFTDQLKSQATMKYVDVKIDNILKNIKKEDFKEEFNTTDDYRKLDINKFKEKLDSELKIVSNKFEHNLNSQLDKQDNKLVIMKTSLDSESKRVNGVLDQVESLSHRVESLQAAMDTSFNKSKGKTDKLDMENFVSFNKKPDTVNVNVKNEDSLISPSKQYVQNLKIDDLYDSSLNQIIKNSHNGIDFRVKIDEIESFALRIQNELPNHQCIKYIQEQINEMNSKFIQNELQIKQLVNENITTYKALSEHKKKWSGDIKDVVNKQFKVIFEGMIREKLLKINGEIERLGNLYESKVRSLTGRLQIKEKKLQNFKQKERDHSDEKQERTHIALFTNKKLNVEKEKYFKLKKKDQILKRSRSEDSVVKRSRKEIGNKQLMNELKENQVERPEKKNKKISNEYDDKIKKLEQMYDEFSNYN